MQDTHHTCRDLGEQKTQEGTAAMGELIELGSLEPVHTVPEIAAVLRVSQSKVRRMIEAEDIDGFKVGREHRVKRSALHAYFVRIGFIRPSTASTAATEAGAA